MIGLYQEIENMPHFYDCIDSIHSFSIPIQEGEEIENSKFIYIENCKYDRMDQKLIEYIISTSTYLVNDSAGSGAEVFSVLTDYFYLQEIDERFINTKYYNIKSKAYEHRNRKIINETLTIKYDDIVDDLYNKKYVYENSTPNILTPPNSELSVFLEKIEYENIACFLCKEGGWQLSKEYGFHKCSPARDYFVKWVENDGKWSLYIGNYNMMDCGEGLREIITTVDTLFDVVDYISKNKKIHY